MPLKSDRGTDVAIVGAGISGAMIAEELAEAGFSVLIIDRRGPLMGSTPASTALLLYEIDMPLTHLARKIGFDAAARAWRRSKLGLDSLFDKTRELGIRCDLAHCGSLYLAGDLLDRDAMKQEQEARNAIGLRNEYLTRDALRDRFGLRRNAALHTRENASADPRRMAAGFLEAAIKRGTEVIAPANVIEVHPGPRRVHLVTEQGPTISASHVVFATGYELLDKLKSRKHRIASTWAIATRPQPRSLWPERPFIWEASDPYLYIRSTAEGRVICGGEDEEFSDEESRDKLTPAKVATLRRKLGKLLPGLDTHAEFAWAGSFGQSTTGLPTIGAVPGWANCFTAMGYGGNGITYSRIAAEIIRGILTGRSDPDEKLFAPE